MAKKSSKAPKPATMALTVRSPFADTVPSAPGRKKKAPVAFQVFRESLYGYGADDTQEDWNRLLRKYGHSTTWVYVSCNKIATSIASVLFRLIWRPTPGKPPVLVDEEGRALMDLLERPNPFQSLFDFLEDCMLSLELTGNCVGGETEVLTRQGVKPIRDLVGPQTLLTHKGSGRGHWVDAEIRSFGVQPLFKVTLERGRKTKEIFATADHEWLVRVRDSQERSVRRVRTSDLMSRRHEAVETLAHSYKTACTTPSPVGIQHGLWYGDGTASESDQGVNRLRLCGHKREFLPLFQGYQVTRPPSSEGDPMVHGAPNFFKALPPLTETNGYLLGWLMGYFAADGCVSEDGYPVLTSADYNSLKHAKDVATLLGVGTFSLRSGESTAGFGEGPRTCWFLGFRHKDLDPSFFLGDEHRRRYEAHVPERNARWRFASVEPTDRVEEVFCAVVPETHNFVLGDGITSGNCYIEKVLNPAGRVVGLVVLHPGRVTVIPDPKTMIAGYLYEVNGRPIPIARNRVIRVIYGNPESDLYGMSPLTALRAAVQSDMDAVEWNNSFLRRGGWPSGVITTEHGIDPETRKRLEATIRRQLSGGKDTAGRYILLSGGLKFEKISLSPKEADWADHRRISRDEIFAAFGVSFAIAGIFSSEQTTARSAGVAQQAKHFWTYTIFPKLRKLLGALNRDLVIPHFDPEWRLDVDPRSLSALQDDVEQEKVRAEAFEKVTGAGMPINMALARFYPEAGEVPWGNVWWGNSSLMPISSGQMPKLPAPAPLALPGPGKPAQEESLLPAALRESVARLAAIRSRL